MGAENKIQCERVSGGGSNKIKFYKSNISDIGHRYVYSNPMGGVILDNSF